MTDKQPVKGSVFLQRVGRKLTGEEDPNNSKTDPETEADHYERETRAVEAKDKFRRTVDEINNPPSLREAQMKQMEEMSQRLKDADERAKAAEDARREADETRRKEAEEAAAAANREAQAARDALHDHQLAMLSQKLDESIAKSGNFQQQFDEYFGFAEKMAQQMGYQRPSLTQPATDNPQMALEIVRLQIQDAQAQRQHERDMENDRKTWDMKLEELRQQQAYQQQQIQLDQQKAGMLASLPEAIGGSLLKGAADRIRGGQVAQRAPQARQQPPQEKQYKIELDVGEQNEFECPHCGTGIAVGPTSVTARCVGCNAQFPIERKGARGEPIPPGEVT